MDEPLLPSMRRPRSMMQHELLGVFERGAAHCNILPTLLDEAILLSTGCRETAVPAHQGIVAIELPGRVRSRRLNFNDFRRRIVLSWKTDVHACLRCHRVKEAHAMWR